MRQTLMMVGATLGLTGGVAMAQMSVDGLPEIDMPELVVQPVRHTHDGLEFESTLIYLPGEARPGVVMVPNWMGPDAGNLAIAKNIAEEYGLVVLMADVYGLEVRPTNTDEAGAAATALREDRPLLRQRVANAVELLKTQENVPVDAEQLVAIGFCFGGGAVLELARSGHDGVLGVVSFHGNLDTPNSEDAKNIRSKVLVLHGTDDPLVPDEQVAAFTQEMRSAGVDYQFVAFGGAVHSFTDPEANIEGVAQYNPLVAARAFAMMDNFFMELFSIE